MAAGQHQENFINALAGQSRADGQRVFVYIGIVGKQAGVRAKDDIDEFLCFGVGLSEFVQLVSVDGEQNAGSIVLFICIFQISGTCQYFQGTVCLYREMLEVTAELIQIEGKGTPQTVSHRHLEIVVHIFIYFADVFFVGECVGNPFTECCFIALGIEQDGISFLSVSPRTSGFLEIGLG